MGSEVSVLGVLRNMPKYDARGRLDWTGDGSTVCHLFIVTFSYMENRKPFNLKWIIAAYNIFQVMACSYLVLNVSLPPEYQAGVSNPFLFGSFFSPL